MKILLLSIFLISTLICHSQERLKGFADFVGNGTDKKEMGNHIIMIKIKKPSGTIIRYDTVFVNKDGITYYELFY